MKKEIVERDNLKQNEFRKKLREESKRIYGSVICFASHKPYKGLVASHIKPYKICELEGDEDASFDVDNGLLLAGNVDAYFDKFDLTFGKDGSIICSDSVPKEIQDDFLGYHLDPAILNTKRQEFLNIHRSLYYYKNYCQADPQIINPLKSIDIPYYDCGIKVYNNNVIYLENGCWKICAPSKVKTLFVNRTGAKISTLISSVDFTSNLIQTNDYKINTIDKGFCCAAGIWNIENERYEETNNHFVISSSKYSVDDDRPVLFLEFLQYVLGNSELAEQFRQVLNISLQGKGFNRSVVLRGNSTSIGIVVRVLRDVLGSYFCESPGKTLYQGISNTIIPNCRINFIQLDKLFIPEQQILDSVLNNNYYLHTDLNIDKYVPLYSIKNTTIRIDNSIEFTFGDYTSSIDVEKLLIDEGNKILGWLLKPFVSDYSGAYYDYKTAVYSENKTIKMWLESRCTITKNNADLISATVLFENYVSFCNQNQWSPTSDRIFFRNMTKMGIGKVRRSEGMYYRGISFQ